MKSSKKKKNKGYSFKKLGKKVEKSRKANGFGGKTETIRASINLTEISSQNRNLLKYCAHLNDKEAEVRATFKTIPEDIDRKCIEATGLNLHSYISTFNELVLRTIQYEEGCIDDPFIYMETIGAQIGGEDGVIEVQHISKDQHTYFLKCIDILFAEGGDLKHQSSKSFSDWFLDTNFIPTI